MDDKLIELYKALNNVLHVRPGMLGMITDVLRYLGSGIVSVLSYLNSFMEGLVDKFITLNNFYSYGPVKDFMDVTRPIVWVIFSIAILILGFQIMMNKVEKRNEVLMNIIFALCFIVVLPDLMVNIGDITKKGIDVINPKSNSLSSELVKSNVLDVKYYGDMDFAFSGEKEGTENSPPRPRMKGNTNEDGKGTDDFTFANKLSIKTIPYINYAEIIDEDRANAFKSETAQELFANKLIVESNGFTVEELDDNSIPMTDIGKEYYYRWHVNWLGLIGSLLVVTIATGISLIKIGRMAFDLAFHQIFGMFVAVTDLTGGQRTKKILAEIINSFAILFVMVLMLKMFVLYSSWVTSVQSSVGVIGALILLIAGAWAIIDAPDIVQRILGIDGGLRSGWGAMAGAYAATKAGSSALKGAANGMKSLGKGGMNSVNGAKGLVSGLTSKTPKEMGKIPERPTANNDLSKSAIPGQKDATAIPGQDQSNQGNTGGTIPGQGPLNQGNAGGTMPGQDSLNQGNTGGTMPGQDSLNQGNAGGTMPGQDPLNQGNTGAPIPGQGQLNQGNTGAPIPGQGQSNQRNTGVPIPGQGQSNQDNTGVPIPGQGQSNQRNTGVPIPGQGQMNQGPGGIPGQGPSSEINRGSETAQSIPSTNDYRAENGYWNQPGMQEAKHYNTTGGNMLRGSKEAATQARNSGYRLGQNVRRVVKPVVTGAKNSIVQPLTRSLRSNRPIDSSNDEDRMDS